MSDSKQGGSEPSMEEILASIRKIISEDTAEDGQKPAAGGDADSDADSGSAPGSARTTAQGPESSPADVGDDVLELSDAAGPADQGDDAPLDLTEEVEAAPDESSLDAEPLELDEQVDGDGDGETPAETESAAQDAGKGDRFETDDLEADDLEAGDLEAGEVAADEFGGDGADPAATGAGAEQPAAAEPGGEIDETPFLADPFDDPSAGAQTPDTPAEAALAAGAMAGTGGPEQAGRTTGGRRSADTASPLGPEDQRVISETAEQQAVEQLTSLARQAENAPGDSAADNVDHILARMVRDALRPQLREWMDRNLPQIVERIVREEVQRMTRRAQGLDDDTRY